MLASVYDSTAKAEDIYAYADKIKTYDAIVDAS